MNPDLLDLALQNKPHATLQQIDCEKASGQAPDGTSRLSYEMRSERGEVIGYIKTWHDDHDYAGFVHFDSEGNIIDWKALIKGQYPKTRN